MLHGELSTELAPLLLPYGKALFEVACKQTGVLGKADEGAEEPEEKGETGYHPFLGTSLITIFVAPVGKAAQFSFEGDDDEEEEEQGDEAEEGQAEGEGDDDDFTVAWEVLDLARTLFEKQATAAAAKDLGETYAVLGDVSLETGELRRSHKQEHLAEAPIYRKLSASSRRLHISTQNLPPMPSPHFS